MTLFLTLLALGITLVVALIFCCVHFDILCD